MDALYSIFGGGYLVMYPFEAACLGSAIPLNWHCIELKKKGKLMRNLETEHHLENSHARLFDTSHQVSISKRSKTSSPPGTRSLHDRQLAQLLQNPLHFPQDTAKKCSSPGKVTSFPQSSPCQWLYQTKTQPHPCHPSTR
jgi:hypothetical protein